MLAGIVACAAGVLVAASAGDPDGKTAFDLTLAKATAWRFDGGETVYFDCEVVLDNKTGREVKVRSSFTSAYDGLILVVRDEKGKEIHRQGLSHHQSPFAPPGRLFPLQAGENQAKLRFPIKLPAGVKAVRVMLVGTLPDSGYDELLLTDVVPVTIAAGK